MEKQILNEIKALILLGAVPNFIFIIIGTIIGCAIYMHDIINASVLMYNFVAVGLFISIYLVAFRLINKYFFYFLDKNKK